MSRSAARRVLTTSAASVLTGAMIFAPAPASADTTEFRIQVYCNDSAGAFPLPGVRVELWRRGLDALPKVVTDSLVRVMHAADDGRVGVTVSGDEDDFYFRIVLTDDQGVRAEHHAYPWAWFADTDTNQNDVPLHDYGTIGLGDGTNHPACVAYEGVRRAYQDYTASTGSPPPFDVTVQLNAPGRSVPGATLNEINWPENWRESDPAEAAAFAAGHHEFAHSFRDWFDGDADHRTHDAKRFGYARSHSRCDRFNEGFAFQEGWAEFWAGQEAVQCPGAALTDFAIEGHVNLGLKSIERWCMNRAQMVDVLKNNRGRIHSFEEFARAADCQGRLINPYEPGLGEVEARPSKAVLNTLARQRQIGWVRERNRYTTRWKKAVKVADRLGTCRSACRSELVRALAPGMLDLQRDQLSLLITSYRFERSAKARAALGPPGSPQFERKLRDIERKYKRRAVALGRAGVAGMLKSARPYIRRAGAEGKLVGKRLRSMRTQLNRGRIPVGLLPPAPGSDQIVVLQAPTNGSTCTVDRSGRTVCT